MLTLAFLATMALTTGAPADPTEKRDPADQGVFVVAYDQHGLRGARQYIGATNHLRTTFRIESLNVEGAAWQICERPDFQGVCVIAEGRYLTLGSAGLRRVRSLRPVRREG